MDPEFVCRVDVDFLNGEIPLRHINYHLGIRKTIRVKGKTSMKMTNADFEQGNHKINITYILGNNHWMMYHHWDDENGRKCEVCPSVVGQKKAINEARRLLREYNHV
jgi:hypothetical protein